jgi:predicted enzyme related to lactoylglutathione lyase
MGARGSDRQIDNIEFNVADIERSKKFYGEGFGWSFTDYGPTYASSLTAPDRRTDDIGAGATRWSAGHPLRRRSR